MKHRQAWTQHQQKHLKVSQGVRVGANQQHVALLEAARQPLGPSHGVGHVAVAEVDVQLEGAGAPAGADADSAERRRSVRHTSSAGCLSDDKGVVVLGLGGHGSLSLYIVLAFGSGATRKSGPKNRDPDAWSVRLAHRFVSAPRPEVGRREMVKSSDKPLTEVTIVQEEQRGRQAGWLKNSHDVGLERLRHARPARHLSQAPLDR